MSCHLSEDLIVEIFMRLPTKSLLRFRSVSTWLCACIDSPGFIRLHTLRSQNNKVMIIHQVLHKGEPCSKDMYTLHSGDELLYNPCVDITSVEYPFTNFRIVGSCNGILCLYEYRNGINLWNPSIRRKVTVRDRPSWSDHEGLRDPIGFGFDPVMDDYKILVKARSYTEKGVVRSTIVYTMKTDTWREIASPAYPYSQMKSSQCIFNGSLHWVVKSYESDSYDDCFSYVYILTFGLSSEAFSRIELPEPGWETNHVTVIKGCLAVISSKHDDSLIWVRRECNDTASWYVAFKVTTHDFEGAHRVFQLSANGNLIFNPFYSGIIVYNPETGARLRFVGLSGSLRMLLMTLYVESLELLDIGTS